MAVFDKEWRDFERNFEERWQRFERSYLDKDLCPYTGKYGPKCAATCVCTDYRDRWL